MRWSGRRRASGAGTVLDGLVALGRDAAEAVATLHRWAADQVDGSTDEVIAPLYGPAPASASRRELASRVADALLLPVDPEELLELSERLEGVLARAYLVQREAVLLGADVAPDLVTMLHHAATLTADLPRALAALEDRPAEAAAVAEVVLDRRWDVEDSYARLISAGSGTGAGAVQRELARRAEELLESVAHVARRVVHAVAKRG